MCARNFRLWVVMVVSLAALVGPQATGVAHAGFIDLGAGWEELPLSGNAYAMNLNGNLTSVGAYTAQPLSQVVNWNTLDPVATLFVQGNSNANNVFQYFTLSLQITNTTNVPIIGFEFLIIDNNGINTPQNGGGGNLLHPNKAHFHIQIFDQNIGFTGGYVIDPANYDLDTSRGVYDFVVQGGFTINPGQTWSPSVLGIHAPISMDANGNVNTSFTIVEIPIFAPEPSSITLFGIGIACMAVYGLRRRKLATP